MPLYEGLGSGGEKTAVVIDLGEAFTKCGFAGETGPRCIIPSVIKKAGMPKPIKVVQYNINTEELYSYLKEFIHILYFRELETQLLEQCTVDTGAAKEQSLPSVMGSIPEGILEDIKVRTCFVSDLKRGLNIQAAKFNIVGNTQRPSPPPNVDYPLDGEKILHVLGSIRDSVVEILFEQDNEEKSVATLILDSLMQYDLSASTFSPDGRVFQVEYAMKAVENSSTAIGIRCKDGVVFGVEKLVLSKLYEEGSNKRLFNVDRHVGMAVAGLLADARSLADIAREEASNFRSNFGYNIPLKHLADRVAMYVHAYTLYSAVRPFGCSFMLGSYSVNDGAQLYMIDPSGVSYGYWGCAIGKARQAAKTEIEKLQMKEMTCRDVVKEVAKIIYIVHDEVKDKAFELELSWVGEITNGRHEIVPKDIREEAEKYAKESLKEEDESDDDNM
ncbi:hypothetical protein G4228_009132 [Cervus hanglu yarkandensis]|nr:hypothetical protein G4228_009132 [Cervus hanglu yarkandensis]